MKKTVQKPRGNRKGLKRCRDEDTAGDSVLDAAEQMAQDSPGDSSFLFNSIREYTERFILSNAGDLAPKMLGNEPLISSLCKALVAMRTTDVQLDVSELQQKMVTCFQTALKEVLDDADLRKMLDALTPEAVDNLGNLLSTPVDIKNSDTECMEPPLERRPAVLQQHSVMGCDGSSSSVSLSAASDFFMPRPFTGSLPLPPSPLPSVFRESAVCPVRVITFRHLPSRYCDQEGLKSQLAEICSRIPNAFYLNVHCIADECKAIVSLNSNEAAAAVMFLVNTSGMCGAASASNGANTDSSTVVASAASEEEQLELWLPLKGRVIGLEHEWQSWSDKYFEHPPYRVYDEWVSALRNGAALDQELQRLSVSVRANGGADNAPNSGEGAQEASEAKTCQEHLTRKLELLQRRLECNRVVERVETKMKALFGDNFASYLSAAGSEPKYSSSSARSSNARRLLFVRNLPRKLDDIELMWLLQCIGVQPVHIWRDPSTTTSICVELPSIGNVFVVLRLLDATDMSFAGAKFSRDRQLPS
uniref:Uncharacterized protein n=1 Tax=Trypanosoma congolense (strain IL3000) TaxID=1068625 RepID=G0V0F1_TRYCI|nr:conserved hypothetical protein [Trypanosoma congolense IL3000]